MATVGQWNGNKVTKARSDYETLCQGNLRNTTRGELWQHLSLQTVKCHDAETRN